MSAMPTSTPVTSLHVRQAKGRHTLVMITAYDYPSALLADAAGVDMLLVGDSLGMTVLGQKDTLGVTMEHMLHHCRAVSAAQTHALVVADMPFLSYETGPAEALRNAGRLMAEGGARAVKLEGRYEAEIRAMVRAGIPVMGHEGLTPQRVATLGGFRTQGRSGAAAQALLENCLALQDAGCFALVLECVPGEVAAMVTQALEIPTIGIGAGPGCDGQVLVFHDVLGMTQGHCPKFVKKYAQLGHDITQAVRDWSAEVRQGIFPGPEHTVAADAETLSALADVRER